jgi:hypothetical protein
MGRRGNTNFNQRTLFIRLTAGQWCAQRIQRNSADRFNPMEGRGGERVRSTLMASSCDVNDSGQDSTRRLVFQTIPEQRTDGRRAGGMSLPSPDGPDIPPPRIRIVPQGTDAEGSRVEAGTHFWVGTVAKAGPDGMTKTSIGGRMFRMRNTTFD